MSEPAIFLSLRTFLVHPEDLRVVERLHQWDELHVRAHGVGDDLAAHSPLQEVGSFDGLGVVWVQDEVYGLPVQDPSHLDGLGGPGGDTFQ